MARNEKKNGNGDHSVQAPKETPEVLALLKKGMRTDDMASYISDFCKIQEVACRDVGFERLTESKWNSMRGGYGLILRALDSGMRAHKMGIPKSKLLK